MNSRAQAIRRKWIKKGLIYKPSGQYWWSRSYASVPTVDTTDENLWRIYFGTRDEMNRNRISYIEVEAGNPANVLYEHDAPVLDLGKLGTFDDCGVMPSWILNHDGKKYLYYIGWTVRSTIPYHNSIGLAISTDGGRSFERFSEGPLFGETYLEPFFTGTSCVLLENGIWKNWYLSCTGWTRVEGRAEPRYHIKYAESRDGINWDRQSIVAVDYKSDSEAGIVRASILMENGLYHMWYSYRGGVDYRTDPQASYRIGYAQSKDGISWTRMDDSAGIDVSPEGWDAEMIEYPHVIQCYNTRYMFYNGNKFGESGFGFAELSDERGE
jgi:predicted GH43/DUF377 family glycosyl hydrolase